MYFREINSLHISGTNPEASFAFILNFLVESLELKNYTYSIGFLSPLLKFKLIL